MATSLILPPPNLWPIGFGFRPTEEELITHYLKNKMLGQESLVQCIREIDLYNYEPWELPKKSVFESGNYEWFFFRAQPSNGRCPKTKRTTTTGYWKSTGEDRKIKARGTNKVIGTRKILVFHEGRSPNGVKTNWIMHEYHLHLEDTNIAYQRPFVICRLKQNAEEKDVSTCDQDEQNSCVASHLKKKVTERAIQGINTDTQPDGHSVLRSQWYSTRQPALTDFGPVNAYDGEVNWPSIQSGASENGVNLTELLNSMLPDEYFDDATSKACRSPWCSEPEPALMDHEPANGNDGEVNNQLLQPGASESEVNLTEFLNSVFVENEKCDEVTSKVRIDSYDKEELDNMVLELQYGGFSSDTDNDAAFGWQNNHVSPSWFHECSSAMQNMPTIKESRTSPLTVKRFQYKEEKEIYRLDKLQVNSSARSGEGEARMCGISMDSDNSNHGPKPLKAQCQPKSSDVVAYGSVLKRDRLKREIRSKAISQEKAKEGEKHIEVVRSPQLSMTDSNYGLKSEAGNEASKCGLSCCGSIESTRGVFSYILTTKRIQHKSSLPLVYVAKAFFGIVMFVMFAQEVLLYGHWG